MVTRYRFNKTKMRTGTRLIMLILALWTLNVYGQNEDVQIVRKQILDEGLFLFRLEKASWNSTDILLKDYSNLRDQINGYLSYPDNHGTKTIFWNKEERILFTVTFDSVAFDRKGVVESDIRTPTQVETELIKLRNDAFDILTKNEDKFFAFYRNTHPNLIPIILGDQRIVFI